MGGKTWLERGGHKLTELMRSFDKAHREELGKIKLQQVKYDNYKILLTSIVKHFEGFEPVPKPCPAGKPTVGYGHVVVGGEPPFPWTESQACEILFSELTQKYAPLAIEAWNGRTDRVWRKEGWDDLPPHTQAAMVSAVYNLGPSIIARGSWLLKATNTGAGKAFYAFSKHKQGGVLVRSPGLVRRRFAEWKLATEGVLDFQPAGWQAWYESHK